jgi:predicted amidophosphoribosyltransferase
VSNDPRGDDPIESSKWAETPEPEAVSGDWSGARPLCSCCLEESDPLQHDCRSCGNAVGQFTSYIPFANIPFTLDPFGRMWERVWFPHHESPARRLIDLGLLALSFVGIWPTWILLLLSTPYWSKRRRRWIGGRCQRCGYDLRASAGMCPECGAPVAPAEREAPRHAPA